LLVLLGLVLLNELAFRAWFGADYLRWYLNNGAVLSLVFGFVTLAWGDLNKMTHLISAHPLEYAAAWLALGALPPLAFATLLRPEGREMWRNRRRMVRARAELQRQQRELASLPGLSEELRQQLATASPPQPPGPTADIDKDSADADAPTGLWVDFVLTAFISVAFVLGYVTWLLIVVPLQYFVYLMSGAPAREATASRARVWYRFTPREIHIEEAWKSDEMPEGATESGFSLKPVSFTATITAALLFAVSKLL
jgi:hypothetical protein